MAAEAALGAFLSVLFERLASRELLDFARRKKLRSQLQIWGRNLQAIQHVLGDAENRAMGGDAEDRARVTPWLDDLKDLAYDLEDLLDEFATEEALHSSLVASDEAGASSSKLLRIPGCFAHHRLSPCRVAFTCKMRSKVNEIDGRLNDIQKQKQILDLREGSGSERIFGQQTRSETTSLAEPFIFGREDDMNYILKSVKDDSENLSMIFIVGMGGLGKTTLAQLVYNDETVKGSFPARAWACVSDVFDVLAITRTISNSVCGPQSHKGKDLNALQEELQRALSGKKFLIVLDDVWNEDYGMWTILRKPFVSSGAKGSKIIVTTRNQRVVSIMKSRTSPVRQLGTLSDGDSLALLARHALDADNFDDCSHLKPAGEKIVEKCGGLPLATKTLGGLLRSTDALSDWEAIAESKIWDLEMANSIPQALNLSYVYLPSDLKRCFVYCTVFPKDYEFDSEDLISLWMAEGLLRKVHPDESKRDIGLKYFKELSDRSFFQPSSREKSLFVMHDLMSDLATSKAGMSCLSLGEGRFDPLDGKMCPEKIRHLSLIPEFFEVSGRFEGFNCLRKLRTLLSLGSKHPFANIADKVIDDAFRHRKHLRVLSLYPYIINEVPNCIGSLRHLRYLNLSASLIRCLPTSMSTLYNLETLILKDCSKLAELPSWINMLINLRCVDISGTSSLKKMPRGIGNLVKLEILPKFIVGGHNGLRLRELKDLEFLREDLVLQGLSNVAEVRDANEAALDAKRGLTSLFLSWGPEDEGNHPSTTDSASQMQVLEWLQPHARIKNLVIEGYGGTKFPSWISSVSFVLLEHVTLRNCRKTETLPSLGLLPLLKEVMVQGMDVVCAVGQEFYGNAGEPFPCLETLAFVDMCTWEQWSFTAGCEQEICPFQRLRKLRLQNCPKLIIEKWPSQLPYLVNLEVERCPLLETPIATINLPSLESGQFYGCDGRMLRGVVSMSSSIKHLTITNIARISELTNSLEGVVSLSSMASLEELHIESCDELRCLWWQDKKEDGAGINNMKNHSLKRLTIRGCHQLEKIEAFPPSLEYLYLQDCEKLEELPNDMAISSLQEEMAMIRSVHNHDIDGSSSSNGSGRSNNRKMWCQLQDLTIYNCPSLMPFHFDNRVLELPSLKRLEVVQSEVVGSSLEGICTHTVGPHDSELELIEIRECEKMKSLTSHLHRFTSLAKLSLEDCHALELECFPQLPFSLRELCIRNCPGIKSLPQQMHAHLSLRELKISLCPGIASLTVEEGLPPNLENLSVHACENLRQPMSKWGLQRTTALKSLVIWGKIGCLEGTDSFPPPPKNEDAQQGSWHVLPPSLTNLELTDQDYLVSLSSGMKSHLTSLRYLWISGCRRLTRLPREGFPASLGSLYISKCSEELARRCSKEGGGCGGGGFGGRGGDYFPLIQRIPFVRC